MAALVIFIGQITFLTPSLDNHDPLFAQMITPGFYLHPVDVADQDPATGRYSYKQKIIMEFLVIHKKIPL